MSLKIALLLIYTCSIIFIVVSVLFNISIPIKNMWMEVKEKDLASWKHDQNAAAVTWKALSDALLCCLLVFLSCNFLISFKNHGYLKGFPNTETEMNTEGGYLFWKQNTEIVQWGNSKHSGCVSVLTPKH